MAQGSSNEVTVCTLNGRSPCACAHAPITMQSAVTSNRFIVSVLDSIFRRFSPVPANAGLQVLQHFTPAAAAPHAVTRLADGRPVKLPGQPPRVASIDGRSCAMDVQPISSMSRFISSRSKRMALSTPAVPAPASA